MARLRDIFEEPLFIAKETIKGLPKAFTQQASQLGRLVGTAIPEIGARGEAVAQSLQQRSFSPLKQSFTQQAQAIAQPERVLESALNVSPIGLATKAQPVFKGFTDLSTKLLEKLKGKTITSKQEIADFTNAPDLKQAERDLFRRMLEDEGDKIDIPAFANKVKSELLPLERRNLSKEFGGDFGGRYESVNLPSDLRGPVANYTEHIYESPIQTSAGDVHFRDNASQNYFAHTRIEDLPDGTRRVIEAQSDLFQKGRLENEFSKAEATLSGDYPGLKPLEGKAKAMMSDKAKLEPYRNTWHERVIREEVKQAAKDGKTKLQFPTGETAMKIEGLGDTTAARWLDVENQAVKPEALKVGEPIWQIAANRSAQDEWIITDVLGDGKFKAGQAVTKEFAKNNPNMEFAKVGDKLYRKHTIEEFDISGKVDTNNPIYRFYEKEVGKYLTNKYQAKRVKDPQGVEWWEVSVKKEMKRLPVEAFGVGAIPFIDKRDEKKRARIMKSPDQRLFINKE